MNIGRTIAALLLAVACATSSVDAQTRGNYRPKIIVRPMKPPMVKPPRGNLGVKVSPSQAAAIAQGQVPGAKVVGVKLLPSGNYAVTLKTDSSVARITVSGADGSVN